MISETEAARRAKISASMKKRLAEHPEEIEARRAASTGRPQTEQARAKLSEAGKKREQQRRECGYEVSPETRDKISRANKGRPITWGDKISKALKGRPGPSEARRKALSEALTRYYAENPNPFLGKSHSEEAKQRMSEALTGKYRGDTASNWKGGVNALPYGPEWTPWLRELIKERDDNTCRVCGHSGGKIDVHHIDFDKNHNTPDNLICLCASCHGKANRHVIPARNLIWRIITTPGPQART